MINTTTDFNNEIGTVKFPFNEMFLDNENYKTALLKEFEGLEAKPKESIYVRSFIPQEQWEKAWLEDKQEPKINYGHATYSMPDYKKDEQGNLITIYKNEHQRLEAYSSDLSNEFFSLVIKKTIDKKYCGRFLKDTHTVQILNEIDEKIEYFEKYVFQDTNTEYKDYAKAAANQIIFLIDKIRIPDFKKDLLTKFIDGYYRVSFIIRIWDKSEYDQNEFKRKYSDLKTFADEIYKEELSRLLSEKTKPEKAIKIKEPINTLEDAAQNYDAANQMYKILIGANLIDRDTKIGKDQVGGNKGHFYSTIELFHSKGYFKRKPTKIEYVNICKNSFQVEVSIFLAKNNIPRQKSTVDIPAFTSNG